MKKIFKKIIPILVSVLVIICSVLTPMTVCAESAYQKSLVKDHLVVFKCKVDPRISVNKLAFNVILKNKTNHQSYTITFYPGSNYIVREKLPQGQYIPMAYLVQGDDIEGFSANFEGFEFETTSQTTEVNCSFGDIHYSGEIKNYEYIDGMIDREKTNELRKSKGIELIDWDKVDADLKASSSESSSVSSSEETPSSSESEVSSSTPSNSSEESVSSSVSSETSETESNNEKTNKVNPVSIIILVVIVLAVVAVIFVRYKNNTLGDGQE